MLLAALLFSGKLLAQCSGTESFTANPAALPGNTYNPGTVVTFCYTMVGYNQVGANWVDGFDLTIGPGWAAGSLAPISPPANCGGGGGQWIWANSVTGQFSGATWGPGYFFDLNMDGNPGNDFGDNNTANCTWSFCISLTAGNTPGASLSLTVEALSDGETGSWGSTACNGTPFTLSTATVTNAPSTVFVTSNSSICSGGSVTLTATGATNYSWSPATGLNTTSGATVIASPASTTTYTVTGNGGCTSCTATTTVTVNPIPTVAISPAAAAICNGQNTALTATGATTYTWSPATGLNTTSGATVTANPTTTTTYTVTGSSAGCSNTATVTVTVNPVPSVTVNPSAPAICLGQSVAITANGAQSYSWSPASGLSATTGTTVTASPTATQSYTVTGANAAGCTGTRTFTVTVNPLPTVSINPATTDICSGGSAALTAAGANTYSWSPATGLSATTGANVTAAPTTTTTYTITGTSNAGCSNTASSTVTVNTLPTVSVFPPATTICDGSSAVLTAIGADTYTWSPATGLSATTGTSVTANPTTTTTYTVTGTDISNCVGTTTVTVTVNPLPSVSVNPAATAICEGANTTLTASGANTYSWSPTTGLSATTGASVTANPTTTTTYTVTGTTNGCSSTATTAVSVNPLPVISVTPPVPSPCNGSSINLTAAGAVAYTWTPATGLSATSGTTVTANPTSTTFYTITGTDLNSCVNTHTFTLIVTASINTTINTINPLCFGDNNGSAQAVVTSGSAPFSYLWSNGQTTSSITNLPPGNISVTITDAVGCTGSASATLTEPQVLNTTLLNTSFNVSLYDISCYGYADGNPDLTVTGGTTPYSFLWNTGATTEDLSSVPAGDYEVVVTDSNGCIITDSISLTEPPEFTATIASFSDASCNGFNDGSATVNASGGVQPYTYVWNTGQTTSSVTNFSAGNYSVVLTDATGCTTNESITISEPPPLNVSVVGAPTICIGETAQISATPVGGTAPYQYNWTPSPADSSLIATNQNPIVSPVVSTTYTLTLTDDNGCTLFADAVNVPVNPPLSMALSYNGSTGVCPGASTEINCIAAGGDGIYTWTINSIPGNYTSPYTATPSATGYYVFTVSDNCGTPSYTDSILVTLYPLPIVDFSADTLSGCEPFMVRFTNNTIPTSSTYFWDFGDSQESTSSNPVITYPQQGLYDVKLIATTSDGCIDSLTIADMIEVFPLPTADFTHTPTTINVLEAWVNFNDKSSGANSWHWDFGDDSTSTLINPLHFYTDTGEYEIWLTVTSQHGCKDSVQRKVRITPDFMIYIPNAFTPDANGLNDGFHVYGEGIEKEDFEFRIFTRWGEQVFSTFDVNGTWYGDHNGNGNPVEPGVYVYTVQLKNIHNKVKSYKGHVVVLR